MRGVDVHVAEVEVGNVYVPAKSGRSRTPTMSSVGSGYGVDMVVQRVVGLRSEKPLHA